MTATAYSSATARFPRAGVIVAVIWLGLAIAAGATGFLLRLPFPGPQLIILGLVALSLAAGLVRGPLRDWIDALPLRALIGVNALRFIGIAFLVLAARDQLNPVFAARAGWGDIAVATLATLLFFTVRAPRWFTSGMPSDSSILLSLSARRQRSQASRPFSPFH